MNRHHLHLLCLCVALLGGSGCRWNGWQGITSPWAQRQQDAPPVLFTTLPPKEELIAALNISSARVRTLQTQGATVSLAGIPNISTEIALEKPGKFRFRASSSFMGQLVDMGSNEEILWFWTSQSSPPNVYFARHDRLAGSNIRQRLAIDPGMFVEALGLLELSPEHVVGEPIAAGKDRVQLVCRQQTPAGEFIRTLQIHNRFGYILEQQITDVAGRPLLNARLAQQRHYPLDGVTLAHQIDLHVPSGDMRVQLNVPRYSVNQPFTTGEATFAFPRDQLGQHPLVDIADPNFVPPGQSPPANYSSPGYGSPGSVTPHVGQAPAQPYRGGVY